MNGHNGHPANHADTDGATARVHDYDRDRHGTASRRKPATARMPAGAPPTEPDKQAFSVDAGSLLRPASRRWPWLVFGGMLGATAGAALGLHLWTVSFVATTKIIRYEAPVASDAYRPQPNRPETVYNMLKLQEIRRKATEYLNLAPGTIGEPVTTPERQGDAVTIQISGPSQRAAIYYANAFNRAVLEFTQELQRNEAAEAEQYVAQMLKENEEDLIAARKAVPAGALLKADTGTPINISARKVEQINAAQDKLDELLVKYTEIHPDVKRQRQTLAALKADIPADVLQKIIGTARTGSEIGGVSYGAQVESELAYHNLRVREDIKKQLIARQRTIELFKQNPPGYWRVLQPASPETVSANKPWIKVGLVSVFFGLIGFLIASAEVLRRELFDNRLKTESDVTRVTGLPVLGTLGDLRQMSLTARENWAFRTWIALQDRLAYSPNHGLICGFTSSNSGDGRSTWLNLLAGAARKCGFRVLTIATRPAPGVSAVDDVVEPAAEPAAEPVAVGAGVGENHHAHANGSANGASATAMQNGGSRLLSHPNDLVGGSRGFAGDTEFTALTASALFTPAMVTEKLMGTETDPLVHIPLPGWTWNLERRKQWQGALNVWRKIDNVVILVELPPASMPESVLLASNLPNLVWLVESGKSDATDTRNQLETLRHARCNLVGAVINRGLTPVTQGRFSRWVTCLAFLALLGDFSNGLMAADATPPQTATATATAQISAAAVTSAAFSVMSPTQRAPWQRKLTLGPGDVLSFSLYGEPELARLEVPIGPDGRISFLEASNMMAAGLTVDEFRERLNEELSRYRRMPQAFVVPVAYKSRKYFVLGKVSQRGAFPLDRPTTLVEAVARAGGMETGIATDRSLVELADLSRSFIARGGQRLPVDFERLFLHGDLSQNIALEPDDYIYFPGGGEKEVFVLGAVRTPGAHVYNRTSGVIGAIAGRGGFSDRAWPKKVLVIRGGLGRPETFEVNADRVLAGRSVDVTLQPKDIIYVSDRPWIYAEELLDAATNAFITSAIVTWTGEKVTRSR